MLVAGVSGGHFVRFDFVKMAYAYPQAAPYPPAGGAGYPPGVGYPPPGMAYTGGELAATMMLSAATLSLFTTMTNAGKRTVY